MESSEPKIRVLAVAHVQTDYNNSNKDYDRFDIESVIYRYKLELKNVVDLNKVREEAFVQRQRFKKEHDYYPSECEVYVEISMLDLLDLMAELSERVEHVEQKESIDGY